MTAFFIRTDNALAGPFTGVELREAALAGIIRHDAIIGGGAEGPWFKASDVGLFSEKKTPLPHPPDTLVPQYQVRGMPGAFQGPFKLRELIGFAARGMLPADALLQSDQSDEWIPARRFHVLSACLNGDLVLIDGSGKVVLRTTHAVAESNHVAGVSGVRAPIEIAKAVDESDTTTFASAATDDESESKEASLATHAAAPSINEITPSASRLSLWWAGVRVRRPIAWDRIAIRPRLAIQLVCLMLVFAGATSAYSYWKQIGLRRDQVIGDWVGVSAAGDSTQPTFGIALRADGRCVLFNTQGDSWTGDFEWQERRNSQAGFEQLAPFSTIFEKVSSGHEVGIVKPTDGYIQLRGFVKKSPMMDGHPVRDLYLRRDGDALRIGYLASVHWTKETKTMEAGWVVATRSRTSRPDLAAELRSLEKELPVPTDQFGGQVPSHLSEAIDAVRTGIPSKVGETETILHECLAYSASVDAAYLLANFGLPDEARRIYRFEIPQLRRGPSFEGSQIVRYGDLKFLFASDGKLRYLSLVAPQS